MKNKMSAVKSIEYVQKLSTAKELNDFLASENALEKPRKTVIDAILEKEAFIKARDLDSGNEVIPPHQDDDANKNDLPATQEQPFLETAFVPEVVANAIFLKIAKAKKTIAKAKSVINNKDYIIKNVDDKSGYENVTKLKAAVRKIRKDADETRKNETAPFREVTTLVNNKFNETINEAKSIEDILAKRLEVINSAKEKAKADAEEKARKALVQEEIDKIKAREDALLAREQAVLSKEEELAKLYPGIIKKAESKKADRELEQPITDEPVKKLSPKEIFRQYLASIQILYMNAQATGDPKFDALVAGVNKNLKNIVAHYGKNID